jgi:hypothetical protein
MCRTVIFGLFCNAVLTHISSKRRPSFDKSSMQYFFASLKIIPRPSDNAKSKHSSYEL